jgi:hypothetical protein
MPTPTCLGLKGLVVAVVILTVAFIYQTSYIPSSLYNFTSCCELINRYIIATLSTYSKIPNKSCTHVLVLFVLSIAPNFFACVSFVFEFLNYSLFRFLVGEGAYKWAKSKGMDLLGSTSDASDVSPLLILCCPSPI